MKPPHKKIVTDDANRPVAVQIDYADWVEIERALGLHENGSTPALAGDINRFAGSLALPVEPLEYQARARGEWR